MFFRAAKSLCLAVASLPLAACNQLEAIDTETGGGGGGGIPPAVRAAFEQSCGKTGCHSAGANAPTLAGAELDAILTGSSSTGVPYVTIGDTTQSYIAIAMMSDEVAAMAGVERAVARMPIDRNPADPVQQANLNTILAWIGGAEFPGGGGETSGGEETSGGMTTGEPAMPTFANVQAIFSAKCSCHAAPAGPGNGNLSLADGMAYANIVGVKSPTTALNLIEPGSPDMSYLFLKVAGGFDAVTGGAGTLMPPPMGGLAMDEITLIEEWITAGAMDN